jgi:hypothetical protein
MPLPLRPRLRPPYGLMGVREVARRADEMIPTSTTRQLQWLQGDFRATTATGRLLAVCRWQRRWFACLAALRACRGCLQRELITVIDRRGHRYCGHLLVRPPLVAPPLDAAARCSASAAAAMVCDSTRSHTRPRTRPRLHPHCPCPCPCPCPCAILDTSGNYHCNYSVSITLPYM